MNDSKEITGQNLIFLISQPRSGSTLLQRILACHPEIGTVAEPWIMLPLLFELPFEATLSAPYDSRRSSRATRTFFKALPGGEDEYFKGVRQMALGFYDAARQVSGKRLFLDKTPRYYCIISKLAKTFPDAKFVLLARNPLAVLGSIICSWTGEQWFQLSDHRHDLLDAPAQIVAGAKLLGDRAFYVKYEDLVANPDQIVSAICRHLGIQYVADMVNYGKHDLPRWERGASGVYDHLAPVSDNVDGWKKTLCDAQMWRLMSDYLQAIDRETLSRFGYEYAPLRQILDAAAPPAGRLRLTFPLQQLLTSTGDMRTNGGTVSMRMRRWLQLYGFGGTLVRAIRKIMPGRSGKADRKS